MLRSVLLKNNKSNFGHIQRAMSSLLQCKGFINGSWVDSSNDETFEVLNPATGMVIAQVANMTAEDAQRAIAAAKNAFYSPEWSGLTPKNRSSLLKRWYNLIEENKDEIAQIMTAESGKPMRESLLEVSYGNSFIEWFAEEARRIDGEIVASATPNRELLVIKQPLGVAALITPWNFPLAMFTRKAGAALAAGCTVVLKPAEDTPLTALAVAKLADDAGIPDGVINVVTTNKSAPVGNVFCSSPDVAGLSFTGSTQVGKLLYRNCADTVKKISLELGGNAPFIVFDSANLHNAAYGALVSKFRNCGQTCVSANRFFVQEGVYNKFIAIFKSKIEELKIGPGDETGVMIGPLINKQQFNKVSSFVEDAKSKNAKVILGGNPRPDLGELFYEPTIITDIKPSMKLYTEEVFGPVATIIKFKDEEEALLKANETRGGLAGYFYSENIQQIFRVARKLEVGMIGVNEGLISTAEAPFGGVKESGIGREGSHHGIDEFVEIKYICLGNLSN